MAYPNWGRESSSAAPIAANAVDIATLNASQAVQDPIIAANTAAVNSAQADLDVAEASLVQAEADIDAIEIALSADNATQAELDAAIAARVAAQALVDAAQDTLATTRQTAQDALEAEVDGIIANTGESVPIGGRVMPINDPRPYINNTAAPIVLTGNTAAEVVTDGLVLDVAATDLPENIVAQSGSDIADLLGSLLDTGVTTEAYLKADNTNVVLGAVWSSFTVGDIETSMTGSTSARVFNLDGTIDTYAMPAENATIIPRGYYQFSYEPLSNRLSILATKEANGLEHTKIDSSAGATTETLAASSAINAVRLFVNDNVTNTATLAVQAGETLNGITDGTFLFSNYSAGTQFRADEVTGGWVVSVVGAETQNNLSYARFTLTADTSGFVCPFDEGQGDTSVITNSGGTITIPAGKFRIEAYATRHAANLDYEIFDVTNGVSLEKYTVLGNDTSSNGSPMPYYLEVSAPTQIQVREGDNGTSVIWNGRQSGVDAGWDDVQPSFGCYLDIQQVPSAEAVLAGMVTPEPLSYLMANASTPLTTSSNTDYVVPIDTASLDTASGFNAGSNAYTVPVTGKYSVHFTGSWQNQSGSSDDTQFLNIRRNATEIETVRINPEALSNGEDSGYAVHYIGDFIVGDVIDIYVSGVGGVVSIFTAGQFSVSQLPTAMVVMPDALNVEENEELIFNGSDLGNTAAFDYGPYANLAALQAAGFTRLRFEASAQTTFIGSNPLAGSSEITIEDIVNNALTNFIVECVGIDNTSLLGFNLVNDAGGTLYAENNYSSTGSKFRVYAVRDQKTVINTTDTPVDDQSASGYMDIGNMRIQWGSVSVSSESAVTITLPAAFASTAYSVVGNAAVSNQGYAYALIPATNVTFTADRNNDGSDVAADMSYIAIGLKP